MGGAISSIFGGGQSVSTPALPAAPEPEPVVIRENEEDAEAQSVRDAEQRKLKARRSMSGTLLTTPLGTSSGGILGRTM